MLIFDRSLPHCLPHTESFISTKYGRELLTTKTYQDNVVAIVIDEAHCILDWLVLSCRSYKLCVNTMLFDVF